MMSTQSDLNERFHYLRDFGGDEVRSLIKAWDEATDLDPLSVIEMAEDADLKEQVEALTTEVEKLEKLEDRSAALRAALEELRYHIFQGAKRFSHEFAADYIFQQEEIARRDVLEVAPDIADDVQAAYFLIEDGEVTEVWTSPSLSSHVAFSRVY